VRGRGKGTDLLTLQKIRTRGNGSRVLPYLESQLLAHDFASEIM
jgi:hypothetical protein